MMMEEVAVVMAYIPTIANIHTRSGVCQMVQEPHQQGNDITVLQTSDAELSGGCNSNSNGNSNSATTTKTRRHFMVESTTTLATAAAATTTIISMTTSAPSIANAATRESLALPAMGLGAWAWGDALFWGCTYSSPVGFNGETYT
jgi:hypothetical protein